MMANNLTPAFPTHPGEILKDELECRGMSQRKLAEDMGISYTILNEILNGHRPLTEKTALLFEAALGIDSEPLMRLQTKYNMRSIRQIVHGTTDQTAPYRSVILECQRSNQNLHPSWQHPLTPTASLTVTII